MHEGLCFQRAVPPCSQPRTHGWKPGETATPRPRPSTPPRSSFPCFQPAPPGLFATPLPRLGACPVPVSPADPPSPLEPQHPKITRPARRQARAPRPRCARASGPRGEAGGAALEGHQDFPKMKACSSVKQTFQIILLDIFSLVLWKTVEEHFIPSALAW